MLFKIVQCLNALIGSIMQHRRSEQYNDTNMPDEITDKATSAPNRAADNPRLC